MANHKSSLKRIRQNEKRRVRNKQVRTHVRTQLKTVQAAVAENSPEKAIEAFKTAARTIRKAGSKGVYHKKNIDRKISRLTKLVNKLQAAG